MSHQQSNATQSIGLAAGAGNYITAADRKALRPARAYIYSTASRVIPWKTLTEIQCEHYAQSQNYEIVGLYRDAGSAWNLRNRPALDAIIRDMMIHRTGIIIVRDWAQLARREVDRRAIIDRVGLCDGQIRPLIGNWSIETSCTPS